MYTDQLPREPVSVHYLNADNEETIEVFNYRGEVPNDPFRSAGIELITNEVSIVFPSDDGDALEPGHPERTGINERVNLKEASKRLFSVLGDRFDGLNRGGGLFEQEELSKIAGYEDITELLGNDGNDWLHSLMQAMRGQVLRKSSELPGGEFSNPSFEVSESVSGLLSFLGLVHDLGEIIHGDLDDADKTEDYEEMVNSTGRAITLAVLGSGSHDPLVSDELINLAFDVELGRQTPAVDYDALGIDEGMFDSIYEQWRYGIELIEYVETSTVAARNIIKVSEDERLSTEEKRILIDLLSNYVVGSVTRNLGDLIRRSHAPDIEPDKTGKSSPRQTIHEYLLGNEGRTKILSDTVSYADQLVQWANGLDGTNQAVLDTTRVTISNWSKLMDYKAEEERQARSK